MANTFHISSAHLYTFLRKITIHFFFLVLIRLSDFLILSCGSFWYILDMSSSLHISFITIFSWAIRYQSKTKRTVFEPCFLLLYRNDFVCSSTNDLFWPSFPLLLILCPENYCQNECHDFLFCFLPEVLQLQVLYLRLMFRLH